MTNCIFCKIIKGEISSDKIFEDNDLLAFKDINPQAPFHILIIPKQHLSTINDLTEKNNLLISKMILKAKDIAKKYSIDKKGYRLVLNCNEDGGQEVYHIHLHLLGKRKMNWPPG